MTDVIPQRRDMNDTAGPVAEWFKNLNYYTIAATARSDGPRGVALWSFKWVWPDNSRQTMSDGHYFTDDRWLKDFNIMCITVWFYPDGLIPVRVRMAGEKNSRPITIDEFKQLVADYGTPKP